MELLEKLKSELTSFEDACKIEGLDSKKVIPNFEHFPEEDREAMQAHAQWVILVKAANRLANDGEVYKPDFSDDDTSKYEIWWEYVDTGGSRGFRFDDCGAWYAHSFVGSRLCFIERMVGKYLAETFSEIWNKYAL